MEAMDLLEECWFFENLFHTRKARMPRCHSDPCSSSSSSGLATHHVLLKKAKDPNGIREAEDDREGSKLMRHPSDPTVLQAASKAHFTEMKQLGKSESNGRRSKLLRTPSLPPTIGGEDKFQVSDLRSGRSPKQPSSPTQIHIFPHKQTSKVLLSLANLLSFGTQY